MGLLKQRVVDARNSDLSSKSRGPDPEAALGWAEGGHGENDRFRMCLPHPKWVTDFVNFYTLLNSSI